MKFSVLTNGIIRTWSKEEPEELLFYKLRNYKVVKIGFTNLVETLNYIYQLREIEFGAEIGHS